MNLTMERLTMSSVGLLLWRCVFICWCSPLVASITAGIPLSFLAWAVRSGHAMILPEMSTKAQSQLGIAHVGFQNVLNVSKYTFAGILALTHCLWQRKHATPTGHISLPLFKLSIMQTQKRIYISEPRVTGSWLLFVLHNLLCGLYSECPHCPAEISYNARLQSPDVCFSRKTLRSPLCSHSCPLCFLMCPGRREHIPTPPPQNSPPSPCKTENSCRVGGTESSRALTLQTHHDLCWGLHCRSDTNMLIHVEDLSQFHMLWGYFYI